MEKTLGAYFIMVMAILMLSACQSTEEASGNISINTNQDARSAVVHMAKAAQTCWFKSKDPAFKSFTLAAEVNSHAGRPRFLIVPKSNPRDLPLLVVQAEAKGTSSSGKFTNIQSFGPLLQGKEATRINADIRRWSKGQGGCAS